MTAPAIEIEGLRKEYRTLRGRRTTALDGLDLVVPQGGVFGFLGPNGAGKTTTIRCLLGLVRPTAGRCRMLGADVAHAEGVIDGVGALVELPGLVLGLTGRRNLEVLARARGFPLTRVDAALEEVDLVAAAGKQVRVYSQGMRQRLGIAVALLKEPRLLILDEPSNGLDPSGIREIRGLLSRLGSEGRTVFLSSHLLSEVQQICDHVAIVLDGRSLAAGTVDEVLTRSGAQGIVVRLADPDLGVAALTEAGMHVSADGEALRVELPSTETERVMRTLLNKGLVPTEVRPEDLTLERVFLELTGQQVNS